MDIHFAIHTYGHSDAMFYVLNGIKLIMNNDFSNAMIKLVALISTSYYALAGMAGAVEGRVSHYFLKTVGMVIVINALLMPKADMLVIDRVSGIPQRVDGLPYAFVLPVGILEAIGAGITALFEQAFSKVDSAPYSNYGMIFGQRMAQEAKDWKITNPEFSRNMDEFISRCIVLEAMIGSKFTPADVLSSDNLFQLAIDNAGTFRKVNFNVNRTHVSLTCKDAGNKLKEYFRNEMGLLSSKYQKRDFGLAKGIDGLLGGEQAAVGKLNSILEKNIKIGYSKNFGVKSTAEEIVRQNMMINALKGFSNKIDLYGYTRAQSLQNSNWGVSGELAKEYLPLLLNIIKALIYASFIFIVPLMILGGGMDKYMKYCVVIFSLQIWPALNSVLNLFIELYSEMRGVGIANGVITAANFNQAHQAIDTIVYVASGLQMSIPFLSFAIVQGGVSSFVHLAGSLQSASSSAASTASQEMESGNRSFDSVSLGSQSIDNKSGFKTDWNQSYMEGAQQHQTASGGIYKNFSDGSSAMNTGGAINASTGGRRLSLDSSTQTGLQQSLSSTLDSIKSDEKNFSNSKSEAISSVGDIVSQLAQRETKGERFEYDKMGEQGQALQQAVNYTIERHKDKKESWDTASGNSVRTYFEAGASTPAGLPFGKASAGLATDMSLSSSESKNKSTGESERSIQNDDTNKTFNNLVKASQNKSWMQDNSIDTSFAEKKSASFDNMKTYQESIAQKREEAESYRAAIEYSKNNSASDSRDMYHEVEQKVMDEYKVNRETAHNMIEKYDPAVDRIWDGMVKQNMGNIIHQVEHGKSYVDNSASNNAATHKAMYENKVSTQNLDSLKQEASNQGLNKDSMQKGIEESKSTLENANDKISGENAQNYRNAEENHAKLTQNLSPKDSAGKKND